MIWDLDICRLKSHCPSNNTISKVQTWIAIVKDPHPKKTKVKNLKPTLLHTNIAKSLKQSRKNKDKRIKKYRQNTIRKQKKQTSATGNNTINTSRKNKKCDIRKVICFNCNKKDYYTNIYTKSLKN